MFSQGQYRCAGIAEVDCSRCIETEVGGLYGSSIVGALRHPHSDFHSECTDSYVYQQCIR